MRVHQLIQALATVPPDLTVVNASGETPFISLDTHWLIFTLSRIQREHIEHHDHAASARARVEVLKALGHPIVSVAPTPVLVLA